VGVDAAAAGTVSIAGPSVRLGDARIAALVPRLREAAAELTRMWPLRLRQRIAPVGADATPKHRSAAIENFR
jgi:hypothetical protein